MRTLIVALGCLAIGSTACGAPGDTSTSSLRLVVAPALAPEAFAAIAMWEAALPGYAPELVVSSECTADPGGVTTWCFNAAPTIPCGDELDCLGSTTGSKGGYRMRAPLGLPGTVTMRPPGHVWVLSTLSSADQTGVLAHEIGHTLGLQHLPSGVMRARRTDAERAGTTFIDPAAIAAARASEAL